MIKFTDKEKESINNIIDRYRNVSASLEASLDEAKKIQEKVETYTNEMKSIKDDEDKLMETLHKKYGEFGIQDVYESLNYGE